MPASTADQVLSVLVRHDLTSKPGGRYMSNSPLRPGSNSHAFSLILNGPEHGAFVDYVSGDKGSLYDLAALLGIETPRKPSEERTLVTTYDYVDETGRLLYQACRYEPGRDGRKKDFTQRVPDGTGGWFWTMDGVFRVLYRLPEVLAAVAAGEPVYIVEGEKDADQLTLYGLTATTNVAGAGKWKLDYCASLAGAHIIVLPDNDAPGAKHAAQIAVSMTGVAASLKIVALTDLPPKGDVSDWLAAGHTIDELHALVAATAEYTPVMPDAAAPVAAPSLGPTAALAAAIERAGYHCVLNTESDEITINGEMISDVTRALLRSTVRDRRLGPTEILDDAVILQAAQHAHAPIRDGLLALQWDGKPHINRLGACLQTDADDVIRTAAGQQRAADVFLTRWLLGAVGRVLDGEQNAMLVLDGKQDKGKSTLVKWLGGVLPNVHCEESINPQDKDCLLRLTRILVWEAGELDATTRKHDVSALKHFLTRSTVTARRAYGRHDVTKPVLTSFIGTVNTNGNGFLPDPTGNRRYLVLTLTGLDWSYTRLDPRQVWAEAVARYQRGERGRLTSDEAAYRDKSNAEHHQLTGLIDDWLAMHFLRTNDPTDMLTSGAIAEHLRSKGIVLGGNDKAASMAIAAALTRVGVQQANRRQAKEKFGSFQRAWTGLCIREDDPTDPTRSNLWKKVGSSHSDGLDPDHDPTDPTSEATLRSDDAESSAAATASPQNLEVSKKVGSVGSVGSSATAVAPPALPYKPGVNERMHLIREIRACISVRGTLQEIKTNLEALPWHELTKLHDTLRARTK